MKKLQLTAEEKAKKAEEYDNARPIDVWKISDYPEAKSALRPIFEEMQGKGLSDKKYEKKLKDHIRAIVLDLCVAHQSDPTRYVSYSRNPNDYKQGSRYSALFIGYRNLIKVVDFLLDNSYAEGVKGYRDPQNPTKSKQSRIRATDKLIHLINEKHKVVVPMIKRDENEEVIILRDEDKKLMEYDDTEATIQMRNALKLINQNLARFAVLLYASDKELDRLNAELRRDSKKGAIDFTQKRLRRVFNNGSFQQGGRFYGGWWQNIPRNLRKYIRINDKDVVECDYSGLHINMLYAKEVLPLPKEDPYTIDGYGNIREFLKQVLLRLVNAQSEASAIRSIKDKRNPAEAIEIPDEINSVDEVIDAFKLKHTPIKKYFCSGIGIDLQYLDSQIAEKVLLHFSKMGYAILPMHDSFIIHHALKKELQETMEKAFYEMFGVKCKVDLKYDSIVERQKEKVGVSGVCDATLQELLERVSEHGEYGTYNRLLNQHRKYVQSQS